VCSSGIEIDDHRLSLTLSSRLEISCSLTEIRHAYDNVEKWAKPEGVPMSMNYFLANPTICKESKGIVAVIVPFNYPVLISIWSAVSMIFLSVFFLLTQSEHQTAAIAAGNAVVLKPSELVPNVSALFEELFAKYMDPSLYRVVNGGVVEVTHVSNLTFSFIPRRS
jgi:acyl-CoA reductase-like NAD-dependent aldehyde dehydrogenase